MLEKAKLFLKETFPVIIFLVVLFVGVVVLRKAEFYIARRLGPVTTPNTVVDPKLVKCEDGYYIRTDGNTWTEAPGKPTQTVIVPHQEPTITGEVKP